MSNIYVLGQLRFTAEDHYRRYQRNFAQVFAASNGKLLAADEAPQVLEGVWDRDKVVLMEFPSEADARALLMSEAYQRIARDRKAGADNIGLLFRGIS